MTNHSLRWMVRPEIGCVGAGYKQTSVQSPVIRIFDVLIFFWDPVGHHPHDSDAKMLLRLATAFNIPHAFNEATADCVISSLLLDAEPQAVSESPNHDLLTAKEAPDYLRVPLSSLYYLAQRRQIPAIQIGGRWRIKKSSLDGHVLGLKTQKCEA